jgi:hypothetical protein
MPVQGYACARICLCKDMPVQGYACARICLCKDMPVQGYACTRICLCKDMPVQGYACTMPAPCLHLPVPCLHHACTLPAQLVAIVNLYSIVFLFLLMICFSCCSNLFLISAQGITVSIHLPTIEPDR